MVHVYGNARALAWKAGIDLETDTLEVLLFGVDATCGADLDAEFLDDFADLDEIVVGGYSRQTLTSAAVVDDGAGNVTLEADDVDFGTLSPSSQLIAGALVFVSNGSAATDVPVALLDASEVASIALPYQPTGSVFRIVWPSGVVLRL